MAHIHYLNRKTTIEYNIIHQLSILSDVDECTAVTTSTEICSRAHCENTEGSYVCLCDTGFSWNGTYCEGNTDNIILQLYTVHA